MLNKTKESTLFYLQRVSSKQNEVNAITYYSGTETLRKYTEVIQYTEKVLNGIMVIIFHLPLCRPILTFFKLTVENFN